jgi:hypothetical protein
MSIIGIATHFSGHRPPSQRFVELNGPEAVSVVRKDLVDGFHIPCIRQNQRRNSISMSDGIIRIATPFGLRPPWPAI